MEPQARAGHEPPAPLLEIRNARIVYDHAGEAVRDVSHVVPEGRGLALLGSNGAGKSTLLKGITGALRLEDGEIEKGAMTFDGQDLAGLRTDRIVARGLALVPDGRRLFGALRVEDNITMGGHLKSGPELKRLRAMVYDPVPRLAERRTQIAGYLSGGEQQMVAVGRALMAEPRLLALDEPTLGLAPLIINQIYATVARLNRKFGMTILLVEQNAMRAMEIADHVYIMENGRVVLDGPAAKMRGDLDVQEYDLGFAGGGDRKSFRDVKHDKRRKRLLS